MHQKISTKGQLTIPKEFREKFNIKQGDEVLVVLTQDGILIKPQQANLGVLRGILRDEIDFNSAQELLKKERSEWRI
jgi:AbrB family looped-hinge helix DNA binding protein